MPRTRAILAGPFASSPFANGLWLLLAGSGRFEIVEAEDHAAVHGLVVDDRPVVVIGEGIDLAWALDLLDRAPNVSVVQLDDAGRRVVMAVDDPGAQRLVRLLEELAVVDRADAGPRTVARLHLVDPASTNDRPELTTRPRDDWTRTDDPSHDDRRTRRPGDPTGVRPFEPVSADFGSVTAWLRLVLALRLLERAERSSEPSFAGWTASPGDALAALGIEDLSVDELRDQLAEADRLLVARRDLPAVLLAAVQTFELRDDELRALLLALAPELDGRFGMAIGVLHDDLNRRRPSITLMDELGRGPARGSAGRTSRRPARSWAAGSSSRIGGTRRCLSWTRVSCRCPHWSRRCSRRRSRPRPGRRVPACCRRAAASQWRQSPSSGRPIGWWRRSRRRSAHRSSASLRPGDGWFERVASLAGLPLVDGDLTAIVGDRSVEDAVADWLVLAALVGAGVQLRGLGDLAAPDHRRLGEVFRSFDGTVAALVCDAPCPAIEADRPAVVLHRPVVEVSDRIELWSSAAAGNGFVLADADAAALAATLPLEPPEIADVVARFAAQPPDEAEPVARLLRRVAVDRGRDALPPAVRSIATRFDWDDLVLADPAKAELRSIATHLTRSVSVLDRWGFVDRLTYGRGVSALFSGASGTGKTMAAQILARELGVELLLVDLSKTVSKYLGETEKNVDTAFRVAERRGGLLLFDEADALFGKRSEVKDAHDRHANVEIAYLLQRMEAFEGIAILTTNLKQNIDDAFLRRLRFIVDFPLPDASEREAIWRRAFPDRAPLAGDIDFSFLGRRLQLTGGVIQQVALHAAFAAAVDDAAIGMRHIVAATRRELDKLGMFDAGRALEGRAARVGAA